MRFTPSILLVIAGTSAASAYSSYSSGYGDIYARSYDDEYLPSLSTRDIYEQELYAREIELTAREAEAEAEAEAWYDSDTFEEFLARRDLYTRTPGKGADAITVGTGILKKADEALKNKKASDSMKNIKTLPRPVKEAAKPILKMGDRLSEKFGKKDRR